MSCYLYPAIFDPEEGKYNVTFPDLPDCYTCGDNLTDAMMMAQDILSDVLADHEETGEPYQTDERPDQGAAENGSYDRRRVLRSV